MLHKEGAEMRQVKMHPVDKGCISTCRITFGIAKF
jgi:hypothetical protein